MFERLGDHGRPRGWDPRGCCRCLGSLLSLIPGGRCDLALLFVTFSSSDLDRGFHGFVKIVDPVSICSGELGKSDEALLLVVNVGPYFIDILTREGDPHTFHSRGEVPFAHFVLPTLVQEAEHLGNAPVLLFHPSQDQADQVFHVLKLGLWLRNR